MNKKDKEIDKTKLNNLIHLTSNLLKLNYVILIVGIILIGHIAYIQFFQDDMLKEKANSQQTSERIITANRGKIYDCSGEIVLARK